MFVVNEDNSIYVTRGDAGTISVSAKVDGENNYVFRAGDVVRFKVTQKKACENVVLQKDFPITVDTEIVDIYLSEKDTKIGDVISKPVDYWYEVELNPFTNPQTIIGYDDDGAKIFKLHPEGRDLVDEPTTEEDVPVVDTDLSLTSSKPVENKVIARAVINLNSNIATLESKLAEEKKTRETQQANAQKQIEDNTNSINSIADSQFPEGYVEQTVATEVSNYVAENSGGFATDEELNEVKETLNKFADIEGYSFVSGRINANDNTVDLTPITDTTRNYCIINCEVGDKFYLEGSISGNVRLYAFIDSSNNIIERSGVGISYSGFIIAPQNTNKLIVNTDVDNGFIIKGSPLKEVVSNIEKDVNNSIIKSSKLNTLSKNVIMDNLNFSLGSVNSSTGEILTSATRIISDFVYVGSLESITISVEDGFSYSVYVYDENKNFISTHIGGETTEQTFVINNRPVTRYKYIVIMCRKVTEQPITDITEYTNAITVKATSVSSWYNTNDKLNNKLIESCSHLGYSITSNMAYNSIPSFFGAYLRGFDTNICNIRFTSDNVPIMVHDPSFVDDVTGATIRVNQHTYEDLVSNYTYNGQKLAKFEDCVYISKMLGMKLMIASSDVWDDTKWNILFSIISKYRMDNHLKWVIDSSLVNRLLAYNEKIELVFYMTDVGLGAITNLVNELNVYTADNPNRKFSIFLGIINNNVSEVESACIYINEHANRNISLGVANINKEEQYLTLAKYIDYFNSDVAPSGLYRHSVEKEIITKYPSIKETNYINI